MTYLRPGKNEITRRGLELTGTCAGSRILDVGCGEGDTVAYLINKLHMAAEGIDIDSEKIAIASQQHPGIPVRHGDGETLTLYRDGSFDILLMECTLSLFSDPEKALRNAFRVLRPEGYLIVSDLYQLQPDLNHSEGQPAPRVFSEEILTCILDQTGFELVTFEDRTSDLTEYTAQMIWDGNANDLCILCPDLEMPLHVAFSRIGYFLLTAQKRRSESPALL